MSRTEETEDLRKGQKGLSSWLRPSLLCAFAAISGYSLTRGLLEGHIALTHSADFLFAPTGVVAF